MFFDRMYIHVFSMLYSLKGLTDFDMRGDLICRYCVSDARCFSISFTYPTLESFSTT